MARLAQAWVWFGTNMLLWMTSLQVASPSTPSFLDAGGRRPGLLHWDELPSDKLWNFFKQTEGKQEREGTRLTHCGYDIMQGSDDELKRPEESEVAPRGMWWG